MELSDRRPGAVGDAPDDRRGDQQADHRRRRRSARRGRRSPTRSPMRRVRFSPSGAGIEAASMRGSIPARPAHRGSCHHSETRCSHPVNPDVARAVVRLHGCPRWSRTSSSTAAPAIGVATPPSAAEVSREVVFDIRDLTVFYGKAPAVKDVSLAIHRNAITALIGPSGCGKSTVLRSLNRMNDLVPSARVDGQDPLPRRRPLRPRRRPDRGAPADRHGLPAPEPVPEVDLRQRRLRPAHPRPEGRSRRPRRARAHATPRSGTR